MIFIVLIILVTSTYIKMIELTPTFISS